MKRYIILVFLILMVLNTKAHNGAHAFAYPINNIIIDGKLDDWATTKTKYSIDRITHRTKSSNEGDFEANFRVAYNLKLQSIYIALEVHDESLIVDQSSNSNYQNQDSHLVYLDTKHSKNGSGVAFFASSYNALHLVNNNLSWDPDVQKMNLNIIDHAVGRNGNITTYEWKIFIGDELQINRTIGLDHAVLDMDEGDLDRKYSYAYWGSNGQKSRMQINLGDVFILEENAEIGNVQGVVGWSNELLEFPPDGIILSSIENPKMWTRVFPENGRYEFRLPVGRYEVFSGLPGYFNDEYEYIKIKEDSKKILTIKEGENRLDLNLTPLIRPSFFNKGSGIAASYKPTDTTEINDFFEKVMKFYKIPSISFALIKDGKVALLKNYGVSNIYTQEKTTNSTLFDAGSVTKTIFAIAVLRLVEKDILDLDKPLYEYLPYPDIAYDDRYKLITARHVLSHKTGFPNWRNRKLEIINDPGTKFGYSGEGFEYLKMVIEHLTSRSIEEVYQEEVLLPMNLKGAYFKDDENLRKHLCYPVYDTQISLPAINSEPHAAYSLFTNASHFSEFVISLLNENGLKQETYKQLLGWETELPADRSDLNRAWRQGYGLGFLLKESPYGLVYGHSGINSGFECNYEIYPEKDLAYIFFTNSSYGHSIKNLVRDFLITGEDKRN